MNDSAMSTDQPSKSRSARPKAVPQPAQIVREYGPFAEVERVHGVTFDGRQVWFASNDGLRSLDPETGTLARHLEVQCDAGTAFDGRHLYQIAGAAIHKLDPATGQILSTIPAPGQGSDSGLTWAEGRLWVGQYRSRQIVCIDPETGKIVKTLHSDRFVTGITWVDAELWHGTWEGEESELRQIDANSGEVLTRLSMPEGKGISGLESDGADTFYCGGGGTGRVRAVKRPKRS
jgi:outer membrane protein assembly factor BamB